MTGFFEESPGVRSMTRLSIFMLDLDVFLLTSAVCYYLVRKTPDGGVLAALGGIFATLVIHGVAHTWLRNTGTASEPAATTDGGAP